MTAKLENKAKTDARVAQRMQRERDALALIPAFIEAAAGDPDGARMASALTIAERRIAGCIADAMSNPAIRDHFGISEETVKRHMNNIFNKLGMDTRLELAVAIYRRPALHAAIPIPSLMEGSSVPASV